MNMDKGQSSIAIVMVAIVILIVLVVVVLAVVLSQNKPGAPGTTPLWTSGKLPWGTGSPPWIQSGGSSDWCVAGRTYNILQDNYEAILTIEGMATYNGRSLCRIRISDNAGISYLYSNPDYTEWYVTSQQGTQLGSYLGGTSNQGQTGGQSGTGGQGGSSWRPTLPWSGTNAGQSGAPADISLWCIPGQTFNIVEDDFIATLTTIGPQAYSGRTLCKLVFNSDAGTAYFYTNQDGSVWYLTDEYGNLDDAYTNYQGQTGSGGGTNNVESGCADGTREAFTDKSEFPMISGCAGTWTDPNLRATGTGTAASLCASGWHVCMAGGSPLEIPNAGVSADECANAGTGKFVAASSHCMNAQGQPCRYTPAPFGCEDSGWCSEPICCGSGCGFGDCKSAIWDGETRIFSGTSHGCGDCPSSAGATGVLCCKST